LIPHGRHELRIPGELVSQHLQRDRSTVLDVLGAVHDDFAARRRDRIDPVTGLDDGTGEAQFRCRRRFARRSTVTWLVTMFSGGSVRGSRYRISRSYVLSPLEGQPLEASSNHRAPSASRTYCGGEKTLAEAATMP
jgi:hypothetical protein